MQAKATLVALLIGALSLGGWSALAQGGPTSAGTASAQPAPTPKSKQFKIISITRAKEYPPPPNTALKVKEGYVFLAVTFVPVPLKSTDDYPNEQDVVLVDSLGEKHGMAYVQLTGVPVPESETLVFAVKDGAKAQEMRVKGVMTNDLSKMSETSPKASKK
jgi:hypothetical protein